MKTIQKIFAVLSLAVLVSLPAATFAQVGGGVGGGGVGGGVGGGGVGGGVGGAGGGVGGGISSSGGSGKTRFECNDNIDNDGDGLIDFGDADYNDPGCSMSKDDTENTDQIRSGALGAVDLRIRNDVAINGGAYYAADSETAAPKVNPNSSLFATYRLVVENKGYKEARNVEVFITGRSKYGTSSHGISNIRGANYQAGRSMLIIPSIPAYSSKTIQFSLSLKTADNNDVYFEYAEVSNFEHSAGEAVVKGKGAGNSAIIVVEKDDGKDDDKNEDTTGNIVNDTHLASAATLPTSGTPLFLAGLISISSAGMLFLKK